MNLIARLKGMWRGHDEKVAQETLEAQSAGTGEDLELTPGLDRVIEHAAGAEESAAEHEEPE
jgi:hypothetical protein